MSPNHCWCHCFGCLLMHLNVLMHLNHHSLKLCAFCKSIWYQLLTCSTSAQESELAWASESRTSPLSKTAFSRWHKQLTDSAGALFSMLVTDVWELGSVELFCVALLAAARLLFCVAPCSSENIKYSSVYLASLTLNTAHAKPQLCCTQAGRDCFHGWANLLMNQIRFAHSHSRMVVCSALWLQAAPGNSRCKKQG